MWSKYIKLKKTLLTVTWTEWRQDCMERRRDHFLYRTCSCDIVKSQAEKISCWKWWLLPGVFQEKEEAGRVERMGTRCLLKFKKVFVYFPAIILIFSGWLASRKLLSKSSSVKREHQSEKPLSVCTTFLPTELWPLLIHFGFILPFDAESSQNRNMSWRHTCCFCIYLHKTHTHTHIYTAKTDYIIQCHM